MFIVLPLKNNIVSETKVVFVCVNYFRRWRPKICGNVVGRVLFLRGAFAVFVAALHAIPKNAAARKGEGAAAAENGHHRGEGQPGGQRGRRRTRAQKQHFGRHRPRRQEKRQRNYLLLQSHG